MSQAKGQVYLDKFNNWVQNTEDKEFVQLYNPSTGNLSRAEIKKLTGVTDESIKRGKVKGALAQLEKSLRERGVLPELTASGKASEGGPKLYDAGESQRIFDRKRMVELESINQDLQAKVKFLEQTVAKQNAELSLGAETRDAINDLEVYRLCPSK